VPTTPIIEALARSAACINHSGQIPCNLESVPAVYNFAAYGDYELPDYCNGGNCPQDTVAAIMALDRAGMKDKAGTIRREIFRRQHQGILPNGSGFYMGVVNLPGQCYSIMKWDGTPTDYEGIISRVRSCKPPSWPTTQPANSSTTPKPFRNCHSALSPQLIVAPPPLPPRGLALPLFRVSFRKRSTKHAHETFLRPAPDSP